MMQTISTSLQTLLQHRNNPPLKNNPSKRLQGKKAENTAAVCLLGLIKAGFVSNAAKKAEAAAEVTRWRNVAKNKRSREPQQSETISR